MRKEKRPLKLYHGILLIVLAAADIFVLSGFLTLWFGLYGTAVSELILLLLAVGTVAVFRGDFRVVFPFRKPKLMETIGTLLLWFGTYLVTMMLTMIITYFFPEEVMGVSIGLSQAFRSVVFAASFLIVSILPAICEEAVFRGVFFNSLWNKIQKKWAVILIVSAVFAAFHGSVWRFVPTFILGIAMGYLVFETNNMFYNMLFHAVNNAVPVILLYVTQMLSDIVGMGDIFEQAAQMESIPLASIGIYMIYGCVGVFIIYVGKYLLHVGRPGYDHGMFPREKRRELYILIVICAALAVLGGCIIFVDLLGVIL